MAIARYIAAGLAFLCLWSAAGLAWNYRRAKRIGLPVVISLVGNFNLPWILVQKLLPQLLPLLQLLPAPLSNTARYVYSGWQYDDAGRVHQRLGPAFVLCTPGYVEVVLADPKATHAVFARRKDFERPAATYGSSPDIFGRTLLNASGETWQRLRRMTAPSLNERVSGTVWAETLRQAREMRQFWAEHSAAGTRKLRDDTATLALHVWMASGFGLQYPYHEQRSAVKRPHKMSYKNALFNVLRNWTLLSIVPMHWLNKPVLPKRLRHVGIACEEFKLYMGELVAKELSMAARRGKPQGNLLSSLLRNSEESWRKSGSGLTNDEIFGNIFAYSLAGFETTANTLAAAIVYLAAYPRWQKWLTQEIKNMIGEDKVQTDVSYEDTFPQLKRCLAVMLETLRLINTVPFVPKITGDTVQTLNIAGKAYVIPPKTLVSINLQAIHRDPKYWGPDASEWRPDRWIKTDKGGNEELIEHPDGMFAPWADGPRVCPGKKFAQVEFVAVMATLFQSHTVKPVPQRKESLADAQAKALQMVRNAGISSITLQMRNPEAVALAWEKQ